MNANPAPTSDDALDETLLRDSARSFAAKSAPVSRLRALRDSATGYSLPLWHEMVELGWTGMLIPERAGGSGLPLVALGVVLEELGRVVAPEPLLEVAGVSALLLGALENAAADTLAARIAEGDALVVTAWQGHPREARRDFGAMQARAHGAGHVLNGRVYAVTHAAAADVLLVPALLLDEPTIFAVPRAAVGITCDERTLADGTRIARVECRDVALAGDALLGSGPLADAALDTAIDGGALLTSFALSGLAQEAFAITANYLKTREQFGRRIGSFQALQHRAVDLHMHNEVTRAVVHACAVDWAAASRRQDRLRLAARAKYRASATARRVTREAIQMHGAIGFTDDCDIGLYLNRALVLDAAFGHENAQLTTLRTLPRATAADGGMSRRIEDPADGDWDAMEDEEFRALVRDWFEHEYPQDMRHPPRRLHWHEVKDWYMKLSARGWAAPAWPRAWGGMGLSPSKLLIFFEEQERCGVARTPDMGIIMVGPLLLKHGTDAQRAHYLPKILKGEYIWCQGYSEPNAGSDLASLRCEAVADGEDFVVNGQKIWTTLAQDATHIFLLVRTDKTAKKQKGISFLLADMKAPGITVRPIRNLTGHSEFCEVFFDDVRVPRANLVGEPNNGWTMAKALLSFERIHLGSPKQAQFALQRLTELATAQGTFDDPVFATRYTMLAQDVADLETIYAKYADIVKRGETLGPDVSMLKIWGTETYSALTELALEAAGHAGGVRGEIGDSEHGVDVLNLFYNARPAPIYGGSNEIQRNIIAKGVLELPDA
ncbi:MAG: acyl-CoA dehydrogenase [Gammaproteobacteria bacterium]|nr:acyl-CoA dehydrogenase [Gammaproteobacteria bacterium]